MFAQYWWHMRSFYSHFRENTNSKYHKGIQYDICDTLHIRLNIEIFIFPTAWSIFSNTIPSVITGQNQNRLH